MPKQGNTEWAASADGGRWTVDWAESPILSSQRRVSVRVPLAALPRYPRRAAQILLFRSVRLPRPPHASMPSLSRRPCLHTSSFPVVSLLGCIPTYPYAVRSTGRSSSPRTHNQVLLHDVCILATAGAANKANHSIATTLFWQAYSLQNVLVPAHMSSLLSPQRQ